MFAIEVEYLGRVIATQFNDRNQAEWPPHLARLYSALVATYEGGERSEGERAALIWLSTLPPPLLYASPASRRAVHTHFVPVNDPTVVNQTPINSALLKVRQLEAEVATATDEKARRKLVGKLDTATRKLEKTARRMAEAVDKTKDPNLGVLPDHRKKQARTFPSVTPEDPRVYWLWPESVPSLDQHAALDGLARSLVRVGHSSTLVRARLVDVLPENVAPNWRPDPEGAHFLRVPLLDQLDQLEQRHRQHQGVKPRVLPFRWQTYTEESEVEDGEPAIHAQQVFLPDDWIVFERADGPGADRGALRYLPATRTADLARRVRDALFVSAEKAGLTLPESISGHRPDGRYSERPHMAVLPLAYVGSPHADGKLRGVALVIPQGVGPEDRRALLRAIGAWEHSARRAPALLALNEGLDVPIVPVLMGRAGVFHMTRVLARANMRSLRSRRWVQSSRHWRSVTPVALDRNPGDLHSDDPTTVRRAAAHAEETLRRACRRQHLPEPVAVDVSFSAGVSGSLPATAFPPFPADQRPGKPRRVLIHAVLHFEVPVQGPVLLGAGRYYGLGLFLPLSAPRHPGHEARS